ncbi:MAG: LemA family protein [Oscillospiraceae bacterium]|nr:LemA family protein [Oscillospiraceae bacterium]
MEKVMKNKSLIVLAVVAAVVIILIGTFVGSYNGLVNKQTNVDEKAATIQADLQRRNDLIPNLVTTVKGYATHEEDVFTAIADARSKLAGAGTIQEQSAANSAMDSALSRLLVVVENYPDLKANQSFIALQDTLEGTENRIKVSRVDYNEAAAVYNASIRKFPTVIIAGMFGFEKVDLFQAEAAAQEAPVVSF